MRVRFIGDPRHDGDGPAVCNLGGLGFPKGEWVGVPEDWPLLPKARTNDHFEIDEGKAAPAPVALTEAGSPKSAPDRSSPAIPSDRRSIIAELKQLQADYHVTEATPALLEKLHAARAAKEAQDWEEGD